MIREASDTRPLSLKSSDNKICTAVINRSVADTIKSQAHVFQNGFIKDRTLVPNPVDVDTEARPAANRVKESTIKEVHIPLDADISARALRACALLACICLFDFSAAFPPSLILGFTLP